jgi:ParB family chromosome partitioning protein
MQPETPTPKHDPKRRALGRGLDALLPSRPAAAPAPEANRIQLATGAEPGGAPATAPATVSAPPPRHESLAGKPLEIALTEIDRNPLQTRTVFDREKLGELAQSIAASGVVQPIVVRAMPNGRYQLVMGERRWLASFEAGKTHIPAIVRQVSDEQSMEMTIVENLQRADLNPMEQARAYQRLAADFRMTQEQMAARTGLPRTTVSNFLRLLRLPEDVQKHVEAGKLSFGHAKTLLALDAPKAISTAAQWVVDKALSVRQTEIFVQGLLIADAKDTVDGQHKVIEPLDPNVREARDLIQRTLGLRVHIKDKDGRGRVTIDYANLDDFAIILRTLGIG